MSVEFYHEYIHPALLFIRAIAYPALSIALFQAALILRCRKGSKNLLILHSLASLYFLELGLVSIVRLSFDLDVIFYDSSVMFRDVIVVPTLLGLVVAAWSLNLSMSRQTKEKLKLWSNGQISSLF